MVSNWLVGVANSNMNDKGALQELCQKRGLEPPTYSSVSSSPVFIRRVTIVWDGKTLEAEGDGRKKKEAEKAAARAMMELIRSEQDCEDDPYSEPVASPSQYKVALNELLQKDQFPLAQYDLVSTKGPAHKRDFTVKCTISVHKTIERDGHGPTIKLAESDAALNMLSYLERGGLSAKEECVVRPKAAAIGLDLVDTDVLTGCDGVIRYENMTGEDGVFLCLAFTNTLAAHGSSTDSEKQAQEIALNNLKHSFIELST